MRKLLALGILGLLVVSAQASFLYEDWESGTDGWTDYGSGPFAALDNTQNTTPGGEWSLKTADTATSYTNAKDYNIVDMGVTSWTAQWSFRHAAGTSREYVQLKSYSGGGASGDLQQLISFGVYNAVAGGAGVYNFRVAVGSVNWANTTISRVADEWQIMKVEQIDLGDGTATVNFYVNDELAASATTTSVFDLTQIRVGSGLGNAGFGAYYDDISITPEPTTLALVALGGLALLRRR
jgi:hypothetical protein